MLCSKYLYSDGKYFYSDFCIVNILVGYCDFSVVKKLTSCTAYDAGSSILPSSLTQYSDFHVVSLLGH